MNTDDTDLQAQNGSIALFDPCKSVVISVICGEVFASVLTTAPGNILICP
jgi:hypothetical protein